MSNLDCCCVPAVTWDAPRRGHEHFSPSCPRLRRGGRQVLLSSSFSHIFPHCFLIFFFLHFSHLFCTLRIVCTWLYYAFLLYRCFYTGLLFSSCPPAHRETISVWIPLDILLPVKYFQFEEKHLIISNGNITLNREVGETYFVLFRNRNAMEFFYKLKFYFFALHDSKQL